MQEIDEVRLNFSQDNILALNISLGLIMFGVALNLRVRDFRLLAENPKAAFVGIFSQFFALPFITYLLILAFQPRASVALGMMMVAACPGGNVSNFMSATARVNIALSVCLTAFTTIAAIFMTPFNLAFYGSLYEPTSKILTEVSVGFFDVFNSVLTILGIPIVIGMLVRHYFEPFALRLKKFMQILSIIIFAAIVVLAFAANFEYFLNYIHFVMLLVFIHNAVALATGYNLGRLFNLPRQDCRTLAIETGIQNSGLGLFLIFSFFDGIGGMAIVAGWWGIWHIIAGLTLAYVWNYRTRNPIIV